MPYLLSVMFALITFGVAHADEVLWMRKSTFGGRTALMLAADGASLYCTGCNFYNYGPIPIQRGVSVTEQTAGNLQPWISTLWTILARVDQGNSCGTGDWYTISFNTHNIERINTSAFQCQPIEISVMEKGLGMRVIMTDRGGHRVVTEVQ
jgi:hypothetical protein